MPTLRVRPQRTPYHARQVARFVAIAFSAANMLANRAEQDEALAADGDPSLLVSTPDGREFLITVTDITAPGAVCTCVWDCTHEWCGCSAHNQHEARSS